MAYDEEVAVRTREVLAEYGDVDDRKMFGGIAFMMNGYMVCGVIDDKLVARVGPERGSQALKGKHVGPMDLTGKPMKGYVYVAPPGIRTEPMLRKWVRASVEFVNTLPPRRS